jgi:ATP-dependent Lon protease
LGQHIERIVRKAALRVVRELDKLKGNKSSESKVSNDDADADADADAAAVVATQSKSKRADKDDALGTDQRTSTDLPKVVVNEKNLKDFVGLPSFTSDRFYNRPPAGNVASVLE